MERKKEEKEIDNEIGLWGWGRRKEADSKDKRVVVGGERGRETGRQIEIER